MLKPLADHIVVEITTKEEKTASGIYLPDTASKERPQTGKVIAVGAGRVLDNGTRVAPEVKVGEEVVFKKLFLQNIPEPNLNWTAKNI